MSVLAQDAKELQRFGELIKKKHLTMKNQQQFGTLEVQPNFPWGKVLFVLLFLFLLVGQCFSQITASEARENTLKDDSEPIIQMDTSIL